jgi:hypothetical protein
MGGLVCPAQEPVNPIRIGIVIFRSLSRFEVDFFAKEKVSQIKFQISFNFFLVLAYRSQEKFIQTV